MPKRVTKGNLWGFIQSRPYASVADMRRLFTMGVDDASILPTSEGTYFIGLPQEAADLIGQLWHEGRIVLDTNPDVKALVVQGVYPARATLGRQPAWGSQQTGNGPARPRASQRSGQSAGASRPAPAPVGAPMLDGSSSLLGSPSRLGSPSDLDSLSRLGDKEAEEAGEGGALGTPGSSAPPAAGPSKRRRRRRGSSQSDAFASGAAVQSAGAAAAQATNRPAPAAQPAAVG